MRLELRNLLLPLASFRLEADRTLTTQVTGLTGSSGSGKTSL
ncbi:MAG: molybdenum ABC transporter ATP-binding protein, partial [Verrucomicrobiaceae bacterium]